MKSRIEAFSVLFMCIALFTRAQVWSGSSLNGGTYRNGPVGIGSGAGLSYVLDARSAALADNGISYQYTGATGSAGFFVSAANSSKNWQLWAAGNGNAFGSGNFYIHDGIAANPHIFINGANNRVGIGTSNPITKFCVSDPGTAEMSVVSTAANDAKLLVSNTQMNYSFKVDANGIGRIGSGIDLINFRMKPTQFGTIPQVWIGTMKPDGGHYDALFAVYGKMLAKSIYVNTSLSVWSDYVFNTDYRLMPLNEVEAYYKANKHLPDVPSAKEMEEKGDNVVETDALLLKKIEELTLYVVQLKKELDEVKSKKGN